MREKHKDSDLFDQYHLMMEWETKNNPLSLQLEKISELLDEIPDVLNRIHTDLNAHLKKYNPSKPGRNTDISAEQALRCAILKQLQGYDYRTLASVIDLTPVYRKFTRFYGAKIPGYTTIEKAIKKISPASMEVINEEIVKLGIKKKVENGKSIRHDTTVTQTDIQFPTDAKLLNDSVRVMTRLVLDLLEEAPEVKVKFANRTRSVKKRAYSITMAKGKNADKIREKNYKELLKIQKNVCEEAESVKSSVRNNIEVASRLEVSVLLMELEEILKLAERVYNQAFRRIINDEQVPASEKLVSIFETHTDIICRGKKGSTVEFGHKIDFGMGRSGMVLRYEVFQGNPGDNEVIERALDDYERVFKRVPEKLVTDRRYFSSDNEETAKEKGVKQIAFPKPGYLSQVRKSIQKSPWFKKLMKWRAGIEGNLSTLLRSYGLKRCLWKGWRSFKSYIGIGVATYNLQVLAAHLVKV